MKTSNLPLAALTLSLLATGSSPSSAGIKVVPKDAAQKEAVPQDFIGPLRSDQCYAGTPGCGGAETFAQYDPGSSDFKNCSATEGAIVAMGDKDAKEARADSGASTPKQKGETGKTPEETPEQKQFTKNDCAMFAGNADCAKQDAGDEKRRGDKGPAESSTDPKQDAAAETDPGDYAYNFGLELGGKEGLLGGNPAASSDSEAREESRKQLERETAEVSAGKTPELTYLRMIENQNKPAMRYLRETAHGAQPSGDAGTASDEKLPGDNTRFFRRP